MDDSETYVNVKFTKRDSQSPSRSDPDVLYAEVNFKTLSAPWVRTDGDCLNSTYSELKFRKEESPIDEDEDPAISSGPGGLSTTAKTAAQERKSKVKIGNRPCCLICLLCLVTFAFIVTVAGLSIYVSQIRQSQVTCERNFQLFWEEYHEMNRTKRQCRLQVHELNSTLEFTISEKSHLDISWRTCLKNLSALNSNLSDLKRMHSDLHHQFTEMETKYRSVNETKAQICELLTSRREQTCSEDWVTNKDRCYYVSTFDTSFRRTLQECSNRDSRLLEINSRDEANFVFRSLHPRNITYWIGQCANGNVDFGLLYKVSPGSSSCSDCKSSRRGVNCLHDKHRFICERSATTRPDIPGKIQLLCQQSGQPT